MMTIAIQRPIIHTGEDLREHLDDEAAPVRRPQPDVDVAVVGLELDVRDDAFGDGAALADCEAVGVVHAGERRPAAAVGGRRRFAALADEQERHGERGDEHDERDFEPPHESDGASVCWVVPIPANGGVVCGVRRVAGGATDAGTRRR